MKHIPVLLDAVMKTLGDIRGCTVVDATFGAGGYSRAFLTAGANVVAFDRDPHVCEDAAKMQSEFGDKFKFIAAPFDKIADLDGQYDAIIFDLGISSMQIDVASRGFSFRGDGPLDMRMSGVGMSAADLIAQSSADEIAAILRGFGDVSHAGAIARVIKNAAPTTTGALRDLIHNPRDVAPIFQALRIAVNDEIGQLRHALDAVPKLLRVGGQCVCVTFHSLEDRLVKNTFRDWTNVVGDPRLPVVSVPAFELVRAVVPTDAEIANNPRARSAHMRAVIKSY